MMSTVLCAFILISVLPRNLNAYITLSPSSHQESALGNEPPTSGNRSTLHQGMYTTESTTESVATSKDMPVYATEESHEQHETTLVRTSTGESQSSPHFSSVLPLGKLTKSFNYNQNTQTVKSSTERSAITSSEVSTITDEQQPKQGLKFTKINLPDNAQQTTNSSEKSLTWVSLYKTPETTRNERVTMTKAQQILDHEKTENKPTNLTTSPPNPENKTKSYGKFDPSSVQPNGTAVTITSATQTMLPENITMTTTTGTTTSVRTQNATTVIATSDKKTTGATTTRDYRTTDKNNFTSIPETTPKQKSTSTTQSVKTQNTKPMHPPKPVIPYPPKKNQTKTGYSAGPTVATLIGTILVLMFIAIAGIFVRQRQMKKKQMEDPDWAGPSPFIEGECQTDQPSLAGGLFRRQETKRISLHSFLPERLSKRLSIVKETDEVFLEDMPANTTFGQNEHTNPTNGKPLVDQTQKSDTSCHNPVVDALLDSVTETVNIHATPANNVNNQPTPKPDDNSSSLQSDTLQPSFEDVDLRGSLEGNTDSTIDIPLPSPLQSPQ